jgi:hypothetical protein
MKCVYFFFFVTYISYVIAIDGSRQEFTDPVTKTYYNFNGLVRDFDKPYITKKPGTHFTDYFTFNFGQKVPTMCKGTSTTVVQTMEVMGKPTSYCSIVGYNEYQEVRTMNPANPYEGIIVSYGMGDMCHDNIKNVMSNKKANFYLYCSESQDTEVSIGLTSSLLCPIVVMAI